ncbi:hypothetical protein [Acidithrix ferrooxidans]|uniref:Uncharacterized protein n=1 Tax=Acidithrix ferrooxidans TaxID=1280514 RepID=A0A0D8HGY2_9ACTN|nr:hypothetical protein [Acidithrix ferrooxidans]KJF17183.1 hypothetical protein AXFE_19940 [Acidithrix ferrooxidans]
MFLGNPRLDLLLASKYLVRNVAELALIVLPGVIEVPVGIGAKHGNRNPGSWLAGFVAIGWAIIGFVSITQLFDKAEDCAV